MNMMNRFAPPPQRPTLQSGKFGNPGQAGGLTVAQQQQRTSQTQVQAPAQRHVPPTTRPAGGQPQRATATPANVQRSDDIMAIVRQLSDLLTKENTALKRHKMDDVKLLGERKEQLARLYQQHMNAIHRDPDAVKAWEPSKRAALAQSAIRLSELMQENASLLKANINAINTFLKTVVDAVKTKHEKQSASYSKQGALNGYAAVKRNLAMSYNQTM